MGVFTISIISRLLNTTRLESVISSATILTLPYPWISSERYINPGLGKSIIWTMSLVQA